MTESKGKSIKSEKVDKNEIVEKPAKKRPKQKQQLERKLTRRLQKKK
jgi:hypothetical protein